MKKANKIFWCKKFIKFLKTNNCYDRFIRGLKNDPGYARERYNISSRSSDRTILVKYCFALQDIHGPSGINSFVSGGFGWHNSFEVLKEQNWDYWANLDRDWNDHKRKL